MQRYGGVRWTIWARTAISVGSLLFLSGCSALEGSWGGASAVPAFLADSATARADSQVLPLRGDSGFSPDQLEGQAHFWHGELTATLDDSEPMDKLMEWAGSDNLYDYGRFVQTHVITIFAAFRATGDLALLDAVDRIMQRMRENLDDSWRDAARGEREGRDGYLNWVWRNGTSDVHQGRDLHVTDEMRTHALVAQVAWAFDNNRDLDSPGGVDYGARADFWHDYLRNHFEAKWRERNDVPWPSFPFLDREYMHPTTTFIRYHYYMYRLTDLAPYREEAERLTRVVLGHMREVETPNGPALVWPRGLTRLGNEHDYLMPSTYSSNIFADAIDLYFEGFDIWADPRLPHYLARTYSQLMLNPNENDVARDIGGGRSQAGIRPTSSAEWSGLISTQVGLKAYTLLAAWDESGAIRESAREIYESVPDDHRYANLSAGLLVDARLVD